MSTRKPVHITQPLLNALRPEFIPRLEPAYVSYYNTYKAGRLATHQVPIEEHRANPQDYAIVVGRQAGPEVHSVTHREIPVDGGGGGTISLRVFEPPPTQAPRPAYVNFHGGGWVFGNHDADDEFDRRLAAELGCVVFDVDYRLAPEHKFPIPVDDCIAATHWVIEHAKEYNLDLARVAVGGTSAGGHIAAVVAHVCRDEGFPLAFQLLNVPACDLHSLTPAGELDPACPYDSYRENYYAPELPFARIKWFYLKFLGDPRPSEYDNNWKVSPIKAPNFKDLAPALVVTAELDPLRDEGEAYAKKMNEAGSKAEVLRINGVPHPFSNLDGILEGARRFNQAAVSALRSAFTK